MTSPIRVNSECFHFSLYPLGTQSLYLKAQAIVRALEDEAKVVEHNLSRVGYMKFSEKVCVKHLSGVWRSTTVVAETADPSA